MGSEYEIVIQDGKRRPVHDVIMEGILGRPLKENEVVHHLNGEKRDNREENIQVMDRAKHIRMADGFPIKIQAVSGHVLFPLLTAVV
ncbi:MAG: HNH endonuclease [Oscillospiraceae bacterium]|nr:HNH endonuclease [Oscillospiraceae bacterium]